LETAFNLFNQLSEQLSGSYQQLQLQVLELSQELATARNERMLQLADKERLADRLERLLETLPAAVILLDGDGWVKEFNPAALNLLDSISLGDEWQQLLARHSLPDNLADNELHLLNGKILSISSSRLEQTPGRILVMLDVTETRKLQARLNHQERLGAMGEMSAQLAHQMRTPLSSALLYASHLANHDLSREQRETFSTKLRNRLQHMEGQISDILMFARGSNQGEELISLSDLVVEFADSITAQLQQVAATLQLEPGVGNEATVLGRRDALLGVLGNLTDNALQHGARQICLSISVGKQVQLRFADDGTGIPAEFRGQIFDPFFTTRSGGTGLGLAIVQNLLLSHHAEIQLAACETGGAVFELLFPLATTSNFTSAPVHASGASTPPPYYQSRSLS
jgi:two-component system sensor histidine kinase FlrB